MACRTWRFAAVSALALMLSSGALATGALAQGAPAIPPAPVVTVPPADADTPQTTPFGVVFTLPKGWSLKRGVGWVAALPPEPGSELAIVDVPDARDGSDAVAKAWAIWRPGAEVRPVFVAVDIPPREGWDAGKQVSYRASPNEHRNVGALASRSGTRWTVQLLDADQSTFEKRQAAVALILQTLKPSGAAAPETFAGRTAHPLDAERIAALKAFVEEGMKTLDIPGVSMALIDHGKVVFEGGFGVRELGRPEPVDAHTLFLVASNTKGMSTLMLARLVDQGRLSWDDPVTKVYPDFRLGSEETTRKVLIKHLVCACTGLPRKDMDWLFNTPRGTPADTTFALLKATQPTSGFGEVFQYNNLMASAAGYIGGRLANPGRETGAAYDAAMQRLVFNPLGMKETTFDFARALKTDHASPHSLDVDAKTKVAPMDLNYEVIPYRPAGGAWSSAHDMIAYVQDELSEGVAPDGRRLVSAKNLLARRAPGVPVGEKAFYGMGLMIDRSLGVETLSHGGSLIGFKSDWYAVPEAGIGAVLLTNADSGDILVSTFRRRLMEVLYDGKPRAETALKAAAAAQAATYAKGRQLISLPPEPTAAAALAGRYVSPDLGRLEVVRNGPDVVFDFGPWRSRVASLKNPDGTTAFFPMDPGAPRVGFVPAGAAGARTLTVRDGQHAYVYREAG